MPELIDDRSLFTLIARGDETAFKVLYDKYFTRLSAYIFKLCKSNVITEDVLQEVFIKLWVNRSKFAYVEIPEAYILLISKNTTIDWLRKLARQTSLMDDLATQIQEATNDAENRMSVGDLENLIASALSQLSNQKQKVFELSRNMGLSHDEIAQELQLSKSTIKNHLSETLKHIKKQIHHNIPSEVLVFLVLLQSIQK